MKRIFLKSGIVIALMTTLIGCGDTVTGSGNVVTQNYEVSGYDEVVVSGLGDVEILQGEQEGVTLMGEDNLIEYITVETNGTVLEIGTKENVNILPTEGLNFVVYTRDLSNLELSGVADVTIDDLQTDDFNLVLSGAGSIDIQDLSVTEFDADLSGVGDLDIAGISPLQNVMLSGAGSYNGSDLQSETATINLSGAGSATIWVADSIAGSLSGVGEISYYGQPESVSINKSGLGSISDLGGK